MLGGHDVTTAQSAVVSDGMFDPAGPAAQVAADLWWLMVALSVPPMVLVLWLLVRAVRRPRTDADVDHGDVGMPWLLLGGVALPVVLVGVTFVATIRGMSSIEWSPPDGAVVVEVEAYNYGWDVHHPENGVDLTGELRIPVGEPVAVVLTSRDVIHSFWVPQLGGKLDAMPGRTTTLTIQADEPGTYEGRCAEFCGVGHARMPVRVVALDDDEYAAWMAEGQ